MGNSNKTIIIKYALAQLFPDFNDSHEQYVIGNMTFVMDIEVEDTIHNRNLSILSKDMYEFSRNNMEPEQ